MKLPIIAVVAASLLSCGPAQAGQSAEEYLAKVDAFCTKIGDQYTDPIVGVREFDSGIQETLDRFGDDKISEYAKEGVKAAYRHPSNDPNLKEIVRVSIENACYRNFL